ncbi:hypothetical protein VP01_2183g1 [Puccinia sorghi]|uniref:Uncharacterized protein n=1 Tax=Puccinia sorghi TaxID=27349 RepID=A0A0L6VB60_9BASI|nr:hypothetical protein VP01_2183g1 [Puccinia sorghi]
MSPSKISNLNGHNLIDKAWTYVIGSLRSIQNLRNTYWFQMVFLSFKGHSIYICCFYGSLKFHYFDYLILSQVCAPGKCYSLCALQLKCQENSSGDCAAPSRTLLFYYSKFCLVMGTWLSSIFTTIFFRVWHLKQHCGGPIRFQTYNYIFCLYEYFKPRILSQTPRLASFGGLNLDLECYFIVHKYIISLNQIEPSSSDQLQLTIQLTDFSHHHKWFSSHILTHHNSWFRSTSAKFPQSSLHQKKFHIFYSPPNIIHPIQNQPEEEIKLPTSTHPLKRTNLPYSSGLYIKQNTIKNYSLFYLNFTYHHPSQLYYKMFTLPSVSSSLKLFIPNNPPTHFFHYYQKHANITPPRQKIVLYKKHYSDSSGRRLLNSLAAILALFDQREQCSMNSCKCLPYRIFFQIISHRKFHDGHRRFHDGHRKFHDCHRKFLACGLQNFRVGVNSIWGIRDLLKLFRVILIDTIDGSVEFFVIDFRETLILFFRALISLKGALRACAVVFLIFIFFILIFFFFYFCNNFLGDVEEERHALGKCFPLTSKSRCRFGRTTTMGSIFWGQQLTPKGGVMTFLRNFVHPLAIYILNLDHNILLTLKNTSINLLVRISAQCFKEGGGKLRGKKGPRSWWLICGKLGSDLMSVLLFRRLLMIKYQIQRAKLWLSKCLVQALLIGTTSNK